MQKRAVVGITVLFASSISFAASAALYAEYYRDNLFLGLAYHRVACLTDWNTVQSNQDYDGFTTKRYCYAGSSASSLPDATWFDYRATGSASSLDYCGSAANDRYGTPGYSGRSETCNYNVMFDCNSDC